MPANTSPIFGLTPNVGRTLAPTTGLTKSDGSSGASGIGTDMAVAFTPGSNGSFVEKIRFIPVATAAATATQATVLRVYLSTQNSGVTTSSNTTLIAEVTAGSQSADHSTTAIFPFEIPLNIKIPTGLYILISTHAAPATNTNWESTVFGMDF